MIESARGTASALREWMGVYGVWRRDIPPAGGTRVRVRFYDEYVKDFSRTFESSCRKELERCVYGTDYGT